MASGIYSITHIKSGKIYVGGTTEISRRFNCHRNQLNKGKHHSRKLQASWSKYGESEFRFDILEITERNVEVIENREQFWIDELKPFFNGYQKAGGCYRPKMTIEQLRNKRPSACKGRPLSIEHRRKVGESLRGRTLSNEHKRKLSIALKGKSKFMSNATKGKISETLKGRIPWNKGIFAKTKS